MVELTNLLIPKHITTGIAEKVLIALVEWFAPNGIKGPGIWVISGDEVRIKESHVFIPDRGFIEISLAPEKNNYEAKSFGDTGFTKLANQVNVLVPGSYASQHELMYDLQNKPLIVLVKDSDCPANMWYQVGTSCNFGYAVPSFETGTTKEGIKGSRLEIKNTADKVYLYEGDITYTEDPVPLVARITGSIVGAVVTLDALDSTIYGTVLYEYEVFYNDNSGNGQSIILPETGFSAEFNTAILTDWNNAGFAVKLRVYNDNDSDTTLTSDSSGERPAIMGGFDEGFDEGFDFNL
jgi:hypothetical protein